MPAKFTQSGGATGGFFARSYTYTLSDFCTKTTDTLGDDISSYQAHLAGAQGAVGAIVGLEPTHSRYAGEPIQLVHMTL